MKRKLFIGSSSESLKIAEQVKASIDEKCSEWLETKLWNENGIFQLNASTLECLVKKARLYDYGVFIADADDITLKRDEIKDSTRDNVIFEAGLFMGTLGKDRAFVITSVDLPSDFNGATIIPFSHGTDAPINIDALVSKLEQTRSSFALGHRQSTALAIGYFNNYVKPCLETLAHDGYDFKFEVIVPNNISDLPKRIDKYKLSADSTEQELSPNIKHVYKRNVSGREYWDIPRLLRTLDYLIAMYAQYTEAGENPEYNELRRIELDNFCNVLEETNKQLDLYAENLEISRI